MNRYALVVGDWHFNSLGMIRSLGENGIPVYFVNTSEGGYGEHSKYVKGVYHPDADHDLIATVFRVLDDHPGQAVLFPSCDKAALELDKHCAALSERCIVPGCGGNVEKYMDKFEMCRIAAACGIAVPQSKIVDLDEHTAAAVRDFGFPCILKPLSSVNGIKADISVCGSENELDAALRTFRGSEHAYDRLIVQQFVHGKENYMVGYSGYKKKGRKAALYGQIEKIREYPMNRGSTSFAVLQPEITLIDPDAIDRFLDCVGYDGIFDLDFKVVDGVPYFIEINFRNGALSYAFTKAGFNMIYRWYCESVGQSVPPVAIRQTYLMSERDDLNQVKDRNISPWTWLGNIRKTNAFMLFNSADPEPFANAYGKAVAKVLHLLARSETR